jgi:hypothetical protein
MKIPFYVSVAASCVCLVLSIVLFTFGGINQGLQIEVQKQQQALQVQQGQINKGNEISQQIGPSLLRDMATVSVKDEKMKELLAKHGYTVNYKAPASPAPGASPAPAPAAPASSTPPASTPTFHH